MPCSHIKITRTSSYYNLYSMYTNNTDILPQTCGIVEFNGVYFKTPFRNEDIHEYLITLMCG